jgi:hypothetical protein
VTSPYTRRHEWRAHEHDAELVVCIHCKLGVGKAEKHRVPNDCHEHFPTKLAHPQQRAVVGYANAKRMTGAR